LIKTYLIILVILFTSCTYQRDKITVCTDTADLQKIPQMSFGELRNSKKVDGKTVSMKGVFSYNFEDVALYPNQFDEGIWLSGSALAGESDSLLKKLNGKIILVIGTIDLSRKGHLGSYFCTLNAFCIREL